MNDPLVSVCLISYNQVSFIKQTIESIIDQKVDFKYELIIADDCSTDGTKDIINDFYLKYPNLIRVLPRTNNLGPGKNFIDLIYSAKGKYIAYLEGDDYWLLDNKLQQQIDILESDNSFSICFTDCLETFSEELKNPLNYLSGGSGIKYDTTLNDLIYRNYIQTCTVVFRNNLFGKFPLWYVELKIGDWPLHLLNAQYGKIKFLPIVSAVHRNHSSGVWSSRSNLSRIYNTIDVYKVLRGNTEFYKLKNFKIALSNLYLSSVKYHLKELNLYKAFINTLIGFYLYPLQFFIRSKPV